MIQNANVTIDLSAVRHNLQKIREWAPGAQLMAVIKANAYGHGLIRMAQTLHDVEGFAVARLDEALALRNAGIKQRIVILQGFVEPEELDLMNQHDVEPVIHSCFQVEQLEQAAYSRPLTVWIKLDTGMHRLGFLPEAFAHYHARLSRCRSVAQPIAMMTHLASADELKSTLTGRQLELFQAQLNGLDGERSVANSAGLLAWDAAHTQWVRPGIVLYGVSPFPSRTGVEEGLKPVMRFRTRLIAIKTIQAGATVGYGGQWVCPHPTRMGIAAVGYGDGYPRHAESGTPVIIRGQRVPLIGRVSMDMINLDLTECPQARVGDDVTLWGDDGLSVEEVAHHAATIPYALLCGITQRVRRLEVE